MNHVTHQVIAAVDGAFLGWPANNGLWSWDSERPDFGYPRLVQRADGRIMPFYYWAARELARQHIAASVWEFENKPS